MNEITLEKIDIVRERTGASYGEAKEALAACDGNVVDALIYIEETEDTRKSGMSTTMDELTNWFKDIISKGNVNRIRIKKGEKTILDVPVNAGVAAGAVGIVIFTAGEIVLTLIGLGVLANYTNISIEIVKNDGSVEVVNKVIKPIVSDIKDKVNDITSKVKEKFSSKVSDKQAAEKNIYKYTVKFEDIDSEKENN